MKKNVGTRTRPIVRTERERIVKRLNQAGRAYDAGRSREANDDRIRRLQARLIEIDTPPVAAEPTPEPVEIVVEEAPVAVEPAPVEVAAQ